MIPKHIHYCWFGGKPLNKLGKKCLRSWKKHFPGYEITEWNESNFDLESCRYVKEAYEAKKWAFVSDYVRIKVLYEYGGIYFDTDVEAIKSFDDILERGAYMGCENPNLKKSIMVNPGLGIAVEPHNEIYKEIIEDYEKSSFYKEDGSMNLYTIVERTTDILKKHGLKDTMDIQKVENINIYPAEYFCPINMDTGRMELTENTHSIHRYAATWVSGKERFRGKVYFALCRILGQKNAEKLRKMLGRRK